MHVDVTAHGPTIEDAADLKRLSVVCADRAHLAGLGSLGRVDGDHVWLSIAELREAGAATVPADERDAWRTAFDGMIAYAAQHGWVEGDAVRAHLA